MTVKSNTDIFFRVKKAMTEYLRNNLKKVMA